MNSSLKRAVTAALCEALRDSGPAQLTGHILSILSIIIVVLQFVQLLHSLFYDYVCAEAVSNVHTDVRVVLSGPGGPLKTVVE